MIHFINLLSTTVKPLRLFRQDALFLNPCNIASASLFPSTQARPRIRRSATLLLLSSSRIVRIAARATGIVRGLHGAVVLSWRWSRWWRRGLPAWWNAHTILLALAVLCRNGLRAVGLLVGWWRKILLVGGRGDGTVGRWVVVRVLGRVGRLAESSSEGS